MKYELLDPGSRMETKDEYFRLYENTWNPIPANWIGCVYLQDGKTTTMDRFNVPVRRACHTQPEICGECDHRFELDWSCDPCIKAHLHKPSLFIHTHKHAGVR